MSKTKQAEKQEAEFHEIDTAPRDLRPIEVSEDGERWVTAHWRETSKMNFKTGRWERTGFWCVFGTQNTKLAFEPLVWRSATQHAA